ncbi:hypothetical protein MSG28_013519 [Choristoneura fumiferana]|uniref:Uncharacterized protein n=1 Tax=Choristoneura fumiferana TaxID=7141 RepID=A0ACC0K7W2_CHOFU|nr:hypothetical protein MSG28_013519 [Choristoneura fumiferana]
MDGPALSVGARARGLRARTAGARRFTRRRRQHAPHALDVAGSAFYYDHHVQRDQLAEMIQILLEAGGSFNTMRGDGFDQLNTPLHTAVLLGSVEAVKLLLNAGASVACINSVGYTPLHLCLRNKIEELLEPFPIPRCSCTTTVATQSPPCECKWWTTEATPCSNSGGTQLAAGVCLALEAGADASSSFDHLDQQARREVRTLQPHLRGYTSVIFHLWESPRRQIIEIEPLLLTTYIATHSTRGAAAFILKLPN